MTERSMDYTYEVEALRRARARMKEEKAVVSARVKAHYQAEIQNAIDRETRKAEEQFSEAIREAVEAGVPQSIIRKDVLRTNDWDRWVYWRDLAGVEPERVTLRAAREAKARQGDGMEWSEDYKTLTFTHDGKGNPLIRPVVLPTDPVERGRDGYYRATFPSKATDPEGFEAWADLMDTFPGGIVEFYRKMSDEI